jgi:hypothetical protein
MRKLGGRIPGSLACRVGIHSFTNKQRPLGGHHSQVSLMWKWTVLFNVAVDNWFGNAGQYSSEGKCQGLREESETETVPNQQYKRTPGKVTATWKETGTEPGEVFCWVV